MFPMHRSYELQGSLKRRRKHPHPTSINGYHTVKNGLGTIVSKRPTFAFMGKSGYTHRLCSKNRIQALTQRNKGSPPLAAAWLCAASEIVTERTAGGSGCTPHGVCPLPPASRPRWAAEPFSLLLKLHLCAPRSGLSTLARCGGVTTALGMLGALPKCSVRRFQNGLHLCPHSGVGNIPTFPQRIAHNVSHAEGGSFSSEATVVL